MSVSHKTKIMLWGRAANRCAFPKCGLELVQDINLTDDPSLVGEIAHIAAQSPDGPRGASKLSLESRDKYDNLILLCPTHHKIIDDHPQKYTVPKLKGFKKEHEKWVQETLSYDPAKQKDNELYGAIITEWEERCELDNWGQWTNWFIDGNVSYPGMRVSLFQRLTETTWWLENRIWPQRYPEVEGAFANFRIVLRDFLIVFDWESKQDDNDEDWHMVPEFYRSHEWLSEDEYHRRTSHWRNYCNLLTNLIYELTRAANHVTDMIRKYLDSSYRLNSGYIRIAPGAPIGPEVSVPKYRADDVKYIDLVADAIEPIDRLRKFANICGERSSPTRWLNKDRIPDLDEVDIE